MKQENKNENEKYFISDKCLDELDFCPCRHDQAIMIVTEHNGKRYVLEELYENKYGGFTFDYVQLEDIMKKLKSWILKLNRNVWIIGKCGECY